MYYVVLDGRSAGPFSEQELSRLLQEQKVTRTTYLWKPGMPRWELAENLPDVLRLVALAPPPVPKE